MGFDKEKLMYRVICFIIGTLLAGMGICRGEELSRAFELRYYTPDAAANGETDFKGETAWFNTDQRIEFLQHYAEAARKFFNDPDLNAMAAAEDQVQSTMAKLKPQPLPSVRKRKVLNDWRRLGYRSGQQVEESKAISWWAQQPGVVVDAERLILSENGRVLKEIEPQNWRFAVSWRAKAPKQDSRGGVFVQQGDKGQPIAGAGFLPSGRFFYCGSSGNIEAATFEPGRWYQFKIEVDQVEKRYNVSVDDTLIADFVELAGGDKATAVDYILIEGSAGMELDDIWGVGYHPWEDKECPYKIKTFLDEDFGIRPTPQNWQEMNYDDSGWQKCDLPAVHGGERCADEDLYLRTKVRLETFTRAILNVESIDPEGEIWINGQVAYVSSDRHPIRLDVARYLKPGSENILAVKVRAFTNPEKNRGGHWPSDPYIGWFLGRVWLDLTATDYIDDVFVYTTQVGDPATVKAVVTLGNEGKIDRFIGKLIVRLYPWLPQESQTAAAIAEIPVTVTEWQKQEFESDINVPKAKLWTYDQPNLYKVEVTLQDKDGKAIDDEVVTMGIRTVSQDGGTFRVNGVPAMLNGAQIMGFRSPLDKIATWSRCPPLDWLVREILQVRNMNGNLMRIHVHEWEIMPPVRGVNDPRLAEVGDQLGIMFMWTTTAWVRTATPWAVDFDGLPKYVRQVRNHPSIVLWETSNHPSIQSAYNRSEEDWTRFYQKIFETIYPQDPSRLITPAAKVEPDEKTGRRPQPWPHPMVPDGFMDVITGYGHSWTPLRKWPQKTRPDGFDVQAALDSPEKAYFNYEHQESTGQPNWNLVKGKPWYKVMSYEWSYDEGSIGRKLTADEWQISQAWQGFSAYEAIRKMRWLDYDGFSWCNLHGGPNNATYMKPLIDYLGHPKLSWYANRMAFQNVLAGSGDVDIVYGPDDAIQPLVLNLGPERKVDISVSVRNLQDGEIDRHIYNTVTLPPGRTVTHLEKFKPRFVQPGHYLIDYTVSSSSK
jgi:hypothetical protein